MGYIWCRHSCDALHLHQSSFEPSSKAIAVGAITRATGNAGSSRSRRASSSVTEGAVSRPAPRQSSKTSRHLPGASRAAVGRRRLDAGETRNFGLVGDLRLLNVREPVPDPSRTAVHLNLRIGGRRLSATARELSCNSAMTAEAGFRSPPTGAADHAARFPSRKSAATESRHISATRGRSDRFLHSSRRLSVTIGSNCPFTQTGRSTTVTGSPACTAPCVWRKARSRSRRGSRLQSPYELSQHPAALERSRRAPTTRARQA